MSRTNLNCSKKKYLAYRRTEICTKLLYVLLSLRVRYNLIIYNHPFIMYVTCENYVHTLMNNDDYQAEMYFSFWQWRRNGTSIYIYFKVVIYLPVIWSYCSSIKTIGWQEDGCFFFIRRAASFHTDTIILSTLWSLISQKINSYIAF